MNEEKKSSSDTSEDTDKFRNPLSVSSNPNGSDSSPSIAGKVSDPPARIKAPTGKADEVPETSRREDNILEAQSRTNVGCQDVTVADLSNSGERMVGKLVAAAMTKYADPRSSSFHGVTKLKWSGKFEAHLWDNTSQVEGRKRKGKHGSYDSEVKAARAHDRAALKYWGPSLHTKLNFPVSDYVKEIQTMENMSPEE